MTGDRVATMAFLLLALTLPLSSLIARRIPIRTTVRLAMIWLAIIAGGVALVAALRGISPIGRNARPATRTNELLETRNPTMLTLHNMYYQDA